MVLTNEKVKMIPYPTTNREIYKVINSKIPFIHVEETKKLSQYLDTILI